MSPSTTMLTGQKRTPPPKKKKKKKMPKIQNLKFHNSFNNFGRDILMSMHDFLGVNLMCTFRGDAYAV